MKPHLTAQFFTNNRQQLLKQAGLDLMVIPAHTQQQRSGDVAHPFKQDTNFFYLTGLVEPDLWLVLEPSECWLIMPSRNDYQDVFEGEHSERAFSARSGITAIYEQRAGRRRLKEKLKGTKRIGYLSPVSWQAERFYGFSANPARGRAKKFLIQHSSAQLVDLRTTLAVLRQIKQPEELACLRQAIDATCATLAELKPQQFKFEYELEAAITAGFRRRGTTGNSFEPIVASGVRATTIHHPQTLEPLDPPQVILDVGAEVEGYAADISRTWAVGKSSARLRQIYDMVMEAHQLALSLLKVGDDYRAYERTIRDKIADDLTKAKVITHRKGVDHHFPHRTSHFLGLDVHDVGDYEQALRENVVLTVEPGIYLPEEGVGVRIEDDVLLTKQGSVNLSSQLPYDL